VSDWRGLPDVPADVRAELDKWFGHTFKRRHFAMGLVSDKSLCAAGNGGGCACDGTCLRPGSTAELQAVLDAEPLTPCPGGCGRVSRRHPCFARQPDGSDVRFCGRTVCYGRLGGSIE
jgi:hypothetical protein